MVFPGSKYRRKMEYNNNIKKYSFLLSKYTFLTSTNEITKPS